jgi:hypothetical protein
MSYRTTQNFDTTNQKRTKINTASLNSLAYIVLGLVFGGFLLLSALNGYLFFGWLALGSFIVFALMGMHFIGQKQIKRN